MAPTYNMLNAVQTCEWIVYEVINSADRQIVDVCAYSGTSSCLRLLHTCLQEFNGKTDDKFGDWL